MDKAKEPVTGDLAAESTYRRLAQSLDSLPQGFPPTSTGIELEVLKMMFAADEAEIASWMSESWESAEEIVARAGMDLETSRRLLRVMSRKDLVLQRASDGTLLYRLNPFIVGSYETTMFRLQGDEAHRFAHLVEAYFMQSGVLAGIMRPSPALHRVVPAHSSVKTEWILPYDDVRAFLEGAVSFGLIDCVCRKQQELLGHRKCDFPLRTCLNFSTRERPNTRYSVSREEALAALDEFERIGLVHTVSNVSSEINYVCNCCGCCCGILRSLLERGIEGSVACANYYATVDADACAGCGNCEARCQVEGIKVRGGVAVVDRKKCIGCGLCVSGCTAGAVELALKPADEIVEPPKDMGEWSRMRKAARGLI